ncbi:MAG: hypothetical protein L3J36_13270 [Rhodobacteraceae bacterium]|nr:hypothetical protein [Paracoccaceae bacterium]
MGQILGKVPRGKLVSADRDHTRPEIIDTGIGCILPCVQNTLEIQILIGRQITFKSERPLVRALIVSGKVGCNRYNIPVDIPRAVFRIGLPDPGPFAVFVKGNVRVPLISNGQLVELNLGAVLLAVLFKVLAKYAQPITVLAFAFPYDLKTTIDWIGVDTGGTLMVVSVGVYKNFFSDCSNSHSIHIL